MMIPEIRPLRQEDTELLSDFHFPWSTKQETMEKWARYWEEQQKDKRIACVLEHQGKIAGYGDLLFHSEHPYFKRSGIPEICDLWIFDDYRNKGMGTLLITHLEQLAKHRGYRTVGIGVSSSSQKSTYY